MCLMQKTHTLDKFYLQMSYFAIGWGFNVNESMRFIKNAVLIQRNASNKVMYGSVDENVVAIFKCDRLTFLM